MRDSFNFSQTGKTWEEGFYLPRFFPTGPHGDTSIAKFKIKAGKAEDIVFDKGMPGFGLRIRVGDKGEHRTFIAQYKIGDKHRRVSLGDVRKVNLEDARKEAKRIFGSVALGRDPANEKEERRAAASHTLAAVIARYLEARGGELKANPRRLGLCLNALPRSCA